ncbi:MAG: spore maturation protein A [Ruminococcus sp.]|nr:spore maturation protein A [Ruminococcus sp.]
MKYIWAGMMGISLVFSILSGNSKTLSEALMTGAQAAVELVFGILGVMCFWSGLMEIGKRSGLCAGLAKLFSPVLRFLFRDVQRDSDAMKYISLNISANLLGIGNAATPFGIAAMKELQKLNPDRDRPSASMVLFVVLNTASLQLFPTTLGAYRARYSSEEPFGILWEVWVTALCALVVGVSLAKCMCISSGEKERLGGSLRQRGVC